MSTHTQTQRLPQEASRGEVRKCLLELDVTKATGPDGISPWVLKEGARELCLPLSIVYNKSLATGELPDIWKAAKVVPIYKKGDRQEALNYRPVSLTCIPCKLMEKIVRKKTSGASGAKELCNTASTWVQGWQVLPHRVT